MILAKQLFKKNRPEFRPFEFPDFDNGDPGDMPLIWDAYQKGRFTDVDEGLSMDEFIELAYAIADQMLEIITVEDVIDGELKPVAILFIRATDAQNWQIEPHVTYYDNATPKIKLRTYVAFLKKTKYRKDIGSCVLRLTKEATKLANRVEKMGLVEYVGKIWGGRPDGNDYLYALRCNRR